MTHTSKFIGGLVLSAMATSSLTASAHAATGAVPLHGDAAKLPTEVRFSVPADFPQRESAATGLPIAGSFGQTRTLSPVLRCNITLTVTTKVVMRKQDVQAGATRFRVGPAQSPFVALLNVQRKGRVSGNSVRWYQGATVDGPPDLGGSPAVADQYPSSPQVTGAAVLRNSRLSSGNYGLLVTASVSSGVSATVPDAVTVTPEQVGACRDATTRVAAPTVRRVLRHLRLGAQPGSAS